jgi:hypothetical protein
MTSIRTSALALLVALVVAGCGGSAASSAPADAGSDTGAAASADGGSGTETTPEPAGDTGGAAEDAAKLGDQLKPPNASEVSKTTTDTYWYVLYESTDSADSLKGYYEDLIPKTGMKIISTTSANGAYVWAIARDESGAFGGSVTVGPSGSGSGSSVIVAVGS